MRSDSSLSPNTESPSIEIEGGLTYNPDKLSIEGSYSDELSQFRAKKTWCTVLETDFLLIPNADFRFEITNSLEANKYQMTCSFTSACGRYAFWRLINEQVPEIQFLLETAHMSHRFKDYASLIETLDHAPRTIGHNVLESVLTVVGRTISQLRKFTNR